MPKLKEKGKIQKNNQYKKENQIIAVWGSPSSGKTVTSVKIAKELQQEKRML